MLVVGCGFFILLGSAACLMGATKEQKTSHEKYTQLSIAGGILMLCAALTMIAACIDMEMDDQDAQPMSSDDRQLFSQSLTMITETKYTLKELIRAHRNSVEPTKIYNLIAQYAIGDQVIDYATSLMNDADRTELQQQFQQLPFMGQDEAKFAHGGNPHEDSNQSSAVNAQL